MAVFNQRLVPMDGGVSTVTESGQQFLRKCNLVVFGSPSPDGSDNGIDLSALRIKFSVKRVSTQTPNIADIRVYNLEEQTAILIRDNFVNQGVILQAGYDSNYGVIFEGKILQIIIGRESATDTFIDILAGDGNTAYNFGVINQTLGKGATQANQVQAAIDSMKQYGVTSGNVGFAETNQQKLPRGKVMFGPAKNYLRTISKTTNTSWSIQNGQVTFVSNNSFLPGERVVLTSKTGLIGTPNQTNQGVNMKCLLNPMLQVSQQVQIDNKSIEQFKINLATNNSDANIPAPLTADGVYFIFCVEHNGDTRGVDWYSNLITLNNEITSNPLNSVQPDYGQ